MRRRARAAARSLGRRRGSDRSADHEWTAGRLVEEPFAPTTGAPRLTERVVVARFLDEPEGRPLARPLPAAPDDRCDVRQGDAPLDGPRLVGQGRRDRARQGRGRRRPGLGGVDGPAGRLEDGAGAGRLVRRQGAERLVDVDPAERRLLRRSRRPAAALVAGTPSICSRCSRSGSRSGSSTGARSSGARRSRRHRSPTCSCAPPGSASGAGPPTRCSPGRSGCSRPSPSSSAGCGSASISRARAA